MISLVKLLFSLGAVTAASIPYQNSSSPSVTIRNGTVIGQNNGCVDSFKGIPFAQPPLGALRLKKPQTISKSFGTLVLPSEAASCPQMVLSSVDTSRIPPEAGRILNDTAANFTGVQSEDCLTINVFRPSCVPKHKKLPVLFWIYGGGWEIGNTATYPGNALVEKSVELGKPMIFVAVNYRINAYGFLGGKQIQEDGSANLGLRDQRKGLEWVAENIRDFGGDPDKVTIWGESAGAISVFDQMIINGGDHTYKGKPLFRGAIMNSGSIVRSVPVDSPKAQDIFDRVATAAECDPKSPYVLDCLRAAPNDTFYRAMNSVPNFFDFSSNNVSYVRRPDPSNNFYPVSAEIAVARGAFAKVPVIMGTQEDEGTLFGLTQTLNTTDDLVTYLGSWFPGTPRADMAELVATYPDDPAAGAPFRTGGKWNVYPQYGRNAALQGDIVFTLPRRAALTALSRAAVPAWAYLATYQHGLPQLGTFHTSDIATLFSLQVNAPAANTIAAYYINFVTGLNPNYRASTSGNGGEGVLRKWPRWDAKELQLINFETNQTSYLKDDFRQASYEVYVKHATSFRQ